LNEFLPLPWDNHGLFQKVTAVKADPQSKAGRRAHREVCPAPGSASFHASTRSVTTAGKPVTHTSKDERLQNIPPHPCTLTEPLRQADLFEALLLKPPSPEIRVREGERIIKTLLRLLNHLFYP